ncbi:Transcriptional regulatory protein rprY [Mucilaginibacter polytrichastri]|uniref:Transcriptional regulatory protein rprY n=1 Tax=Mucilaginibacter polytrichastri TaxID=1302689 RepID=A0A1Q6A3M8_9SPHI|nr:Transcriptional regulatory protein rprY [Mucilaginibacter polytrichastri]
MLEDELQLAKIVTETLQSRGFAVTHLNNGRLGLQAVYKTDFDICVVDVMMPFMDGFTFVKELRKVNPTIPVLFLTARSQDKDVVEGYSTGGNDYLKKPFSLEELILRINELLRRNNHQTEKAAPVSIGTFYFYPQRQELTNNEVIIKLSHKESELLYLLAQHKNQLLDRKATLLKLWGDDNSFNVRTMDVFITKLRKHLQADLSIQIINVRGLGYKLIA